MPVYNEEGCVEAVVKSWRDRLQSLSLRFIMVLVNDGSTDGTAGILRGLSDEDRIMVIHQSNMGHGPAILRGYRQAVPCAEWVFQCDSDNEMSPDSFGELWARRGEYDAVLGVRRNRRQSLSRGIITRCSRLAVRLIFGPAIEDVNSPYRLMRSGVLRPILDYVPSDAFAPNVIICGALASCGARVGLVGVPTQPRRTGRVSLARWRLWKGAFRSLVQTLICGRRLRRELKIEPERSAPQPRPSTPGPLRIEAISSSPAPAGRRSDVGTGR